MIGLSSSPSLRLPALVDRGQITYGEDVFASGHTEYSVPGLSASPRSIHRWHGET